MVSPNPSSMVSDEQDQWWKFFFFRKKTFSSLQAKRCLKKFFFQTSFIFCKKIKNEVWVWKKTFLSFDVQSITSHLRQIIICRYPLSEAKKDSVTLVCVSRFKKKRSFFLMKKIYFFRKNAKKPPFLEREGVF